MRFRFAVAAVAVALAASGLYATGFLQPAPEESTPDEGPERTGFLAPPRDAPLELMHVIDTASAEPGTPFEGFDAFSLNLADLNGNGSLELVTFNDNARVYVLDAVSGSVLSEIETPHTNAEGRPYSDPGADPGDDIDVWHRQTLNGVSLGDVTGNGHMDLVILNTAGHLEVHELDRDASTGDALVWVKQWGQLLDVSKWDPDFFDANPWWDERPWASGAHGHPFVADVGDPDGNWVFAQADDWPGQFAFNSKGELQWKYTWWDGHAGPWVGDLLGDGRKEAVFPTDNGRVLVMDAWTGDEHWMFKAQEHGAYPGSMPVMPLVADFDGDGEKSLFVGARVAEKGDGEPGWKRGQNAMYFMLDRWGNVEWQTAPDFGHPLYHMQPVPFDVTGNGVRDVIVLDWNTIGHNPGDWQHLGPANLFALDGATGDVLWRTEADMAFSRANVAVADFLPDSEGPEILVADARDGRDGLSLVSVHNGEKRAWVPAPDGWTLTRGPALADVTGDGFMEAVVPAARPAEDCSLPTDPDREREDVGCREGAILVYRTSAPAETTVWSNNLLYNESLDTEPLPYGKRVPTWRDVVSG